MGKALSRKNAVRLRRAPGFWCLAFVLGAALIVMPPAVGGQSVKLKGTGVSGGGSSNSSELWDAVDAAIGLTGLWGSIDTANDKDPFIYTEPVTGTVHLFWAKWNGALHQVAHASRPLGWSWNGVEIVAASAPNGHDNVTPRAIVDSQGFLHVAWTRRSSFTSSVYHAVRVSGGWTQPDLLSGPDIASEPFPWLDGTLTMVDYQTPMDLVTVEITISIAGWSGGSDDIDPSQVTVESETVNRTLMPR
jgi:hypothetical protein